MTWKGRPEQGAFSCFIAFIRNTGEKAGYREIKGARAGKETDTDERATIQATLVKKKRSEGGPHRIPQGRRYLGDYRQ